MTVLDNKSKRGRCSIQELNERKVLIKAKALAKVYFKYHKEYEDELRELAYVCTKAWPRTAEFKKDFSY